MTSSTGYYRNIEKEVMRAFKSLRNLKTDIYGIKQTIDILNKREIYTLDQISQCVTNLKKRGIVLNFKGKWFTSQKIPVPVPEGYKECPICTTVFAPEINQKYCTKECRVNHLNRNKALI